MSKINQIQQALLELDGGQLQKLADAYLVGRGVGRVNSIGSVVAANKVKKGTPDALFATPRGTFIFAEHTTQQVGLLTKMKGDLSKCFDESKTGIAINKIERVIFCFTGRLSSAEESELAEECQEKGVNLDLFGIDALAFDLYSKYPGLALDFLGVQIDTGQIVPPEQFISLYNKGKLATRLDLGFHFREEELTRLLDALEAERLVVVSGRAGVGKSRLVLEVSKKFTEAHPEYEVFCIFGRNRDLWEDLQSHFRRPGKFLILVDDANRVSKFDYIVDLILHQREDQQIKVIATVRDYALAKVRDAARPLGGGAEEELEPFTDDQIKGLIADEYEIRNSHYLDRIVEIARGNPRLAVMAAEVAKKGPLNSIYDVSGLYDNYFSSIREDLKGEGADFRNADLLKVAAIVSFFKAVDRTNEEMMNSIEQAFGITRAAFWEAADRLHELEVLDMHEDEVARVSDQVLGTYLFYLAAFKERAIDFGALLCHFFPRLRQRLIDSINPVLSAFDSEHIINAMRPHVERMWSKLEDKGDSEGFLHLLDVFWFVKRTETLLWALKRIDKLETEPLVMSSISFKKSSDSIPSPSILSVLRPFAFAEEEEMRMALDLLSRYAAKRPSQTPLLLRMLIEDYGFRNDSYLRGFKIQSAVVEVFGGSVQGGLPFFTKLFLAIARDYLGTHFDSHRMKNSRTIEISRFDLPATPELASLREAIWNRLTTIFTNVEFREDVLRLIKKYSLNHLRLTNSEVIKWDADRLLPFLESTLDPNEYRHCVVLHDYLNLLERHNIDFPESLRERFSNDTYRLAEILLPEWGERQGLNLSYEEYKQYKRSRLERETSEYTFDDYTRFFDHCLTIQGVLGEKRNDHNLASEVVNVFPAMADRAPDLYAQVLEYYLELQDPFRLLGYIPVHKLVEQGGFDETLRLLSGAEYPTKRRWLFYLHEVLPADAIDKLKLSHLYDLYRIAEQVDLPCGFDYLLKYLLVDQRVVAKVVGVIMEKLERDPGFAHALTMMFNPYSEVGKRVVDLFAEDLDLLKRSYLAVDATRDHSDYDGSLLSQLIDLCPKFIEEYIGWKYQTAERGWVSSHDDHRDYSFIWKRPDHQEIMDRVVSTVYENEKDNYISIAPYLMTFFQKEEREPSSKVQKMQDSYLLGLIGQRSNDSEFMRYLFGVISELSAERRRLFVEYFVRENQSFEAFEDLSLEPNSWSWSGSMVPMLQGRVDFWKSLLPIMNTVELLLHKQYVEHHIQSLLAGIEREKKKDFMED